MTLRNSLLFAALVHSVRGDACATRHWNEGENAFWACMGGLTCHRASAPNEGQWALDRRAWRRIDGATLLRLQTPAEQPPRRPAEPQRNFG